MCRAFRPIRPILPLLVLVIAACSQDATEPVALEASVGSGSDTECVGTLTGTFDNVVVPPGANCTVFNSTVLGSVKALERSILTIGGATDVRGNVEGDKANSVRVFGGTVGGSIQIKEANAPTRDDVGFQVVSGVLLPEGNISIEKNNTFSIVIQNSILLKGNIKVEENTSSTFFEIPRNRVEQNLQVSKNQGPAPKSVTDNVVGENLQYFENAMPFVGGPNVAGKAEGQCF